MATPFSFKASTLLFHLLIQKPDYLLVLPWHFKDEIVKRESEYIENGGTLIFPLPKFTLVAKKNEFF